EESNGKRCRSTKRGGMEDNPRMVERSRGRTAQRSPLAAQGLHPCLGKAWRARHGEAMDCQNLVERFGALTDWDPNLVDPCTWFHVVCDGDNRVIRLEIFGNNISGPIPSEFGSLANLISLDLSSNSISGAIPAALGNAKRLDHNLLTGLIPRELAGLPNLGIV
ncbi:hypothetical protein ACJX0J_019913, partial [Zea mays]